MQIDLRGSNAFVTCVEGNILQINPTALEDGTAKMSKGMRGQSWQSDQGPDLFNDIIDRTQRDATDSVTIRLRQKEGTIFLASKGSKDAGAFIPEIALEEFS